MTGMFTPKSSAEHVAAPSYRTTIETDYPLWETLDRCVELAEKIASGTDDHLDGPTLVCHLRVLRDDLELTEDESNG